tara:strand:+ start:115 stop:1062 length:948 start_codon:yes stop_codon:yes gene_type:complete
MATITTTQSFTTGDQVTAATLNAIATGSAFDTSVVDDSSTALTTNASGTANSRIIVKDGGVSTAKIADSAVTTAKLSLTDGITAKKTGASETIASFVTDQGSNLNRGLFIQTPDSATDTDFPVVLNTGNSMSFEVDNNEAMRIHPQRQITIGTTTIDGQGGASFRPNFDDGAARLTFNRANSTNNSVVLEFQNNDTTVGQIFHNNSSTTFSTSSDYRLKEDIVEMKDSISRVQALKPVNFAWKVDGTRVDGFLAHEAQEVVPEAVIGNKDAVDEDGQPEYQGIDQSKLVPLLTKALQESLTKIESLEARVAALES